jgi:hypothetical protein
MSGLGNELETDLALDLGLGLSLELIEFGNGPVWKAPMYSAKEMD